MNVQNNNTFRLPVTLALIPAGSNEADLALATAVGLDVQHELLAIGDRIETPESSTTTRGGDFIVTVITTVEQLATSTWAHKEVAEQLINDANSLLSLCKDAIAPIVLALIHAHRKQKSMTSVDDKLQTIRVTVEINHKQVTVEAVDEQQIEAGLRIAQQFYASYPQEAQHVSPKSQVKIQGHLPAQKPRKRR